MTSCKNCRTVLLRWLNQKPGYLLFVALVAIVTIYHYGDWEVVENLTFVNHLKSDFGLEHDSFGRILYMVPMIWAGFLFRQKGALIISFAALACMLPHAVFISTHTQDAIFEASTVFIIGSLVALIISLLRIEQKQRIQLSVLNQVSNVISQSLELSEILIGSINKIAEVLCFETALVYLTDRQTGKLTLVAHRGIEEELVQSMPLITPGEGLLGKVAETGEPLLAEKASHHVDLFGLMSGEKKEGSALVVALKCQGNVLGILCVISDGHHHFNKHETDLLNAIAGQIGVAVDKSYRYEQAWQVSEQLAASEERYRELFENANDAIWVHDLHGNIIAVNKSLIELTGYSFAELQGMQANDLIADGCAQYEKAIDDPLAKSEAMKRLSELVLTKKDRSEAWVQFSTSPVFSNGQLVAFQHMARDITKEKRMRENLRFYLQQITRAQEEERKRIARELHDETIQALASLSLDLDGLATTSESLSSNDRLTLENLRQRVNSMTDDVRRLSQDLRPATLDRLGLLPALEWLANDVEKRSGIASQFRMHGSERRLPAEVELLLFRTAQEALRNSWRHSQATCIEVIVGFEEAMIRITIRDNGIGFDPSLRIGELVKGGRLGLAGMRERVQLLGGTLDIKSQRGKGTIVTIEVPISDMVGDNVLR